MMMALNGHKRWENDTKKKSRGFEMAAKKAAAGEKKSPKNCKNFLIRKLTKFATVLF